MKTYKTWEMIKELTENPSKKFMCKSGPRKGRTVGFDGRSIDWHDEYRTNEFEKSYFSIKSTLNWEWEEVKEPVTFIKLIEEVKAKPSTTFKYSNKELNYHFTGNLAQFLFDIADGFLNATIAEVISEGEFCIEG